MKKGQKKATQALPTPLTKEAPTPEKDNDGELEKLPRHIEFLRWYLGRPHDNFSKLKSYMTIGLSVDRRNKSVTSQQTFHRFSRLSVEGDGCFELLEATGRPADAPTSPHEWIQRAALRRQLNNRHDGAPLDNSERLPNATMCCLHYGNGTESFPAMSYRLVLAQDTLLPGDAVRVCPLSVLRCDDEIRFYAQLSSTNDGPVMVKDVSKYWARSPVALWPSELPYYHGIGARHVAQEAVVSFPSTLLELRPCPALGEGQLQVVAAEYLHEGTCFLYGGAVRERYVRQAKRPRDPALRATHTTLPQSPDYSTIIPSEEVYSIELSAARTCIGQNITRFINHRYHMSGFGNVMLLDVMIAVARDDEDIALHEGGDSARSAPSSSTAASHGAAMVAKDRNTVFLNIPFFITKTSVHAGTQLTTVSYGADYDAKLERIVMTDRYWVPFCCTARIGMRSRPLPGLSPAYTGSYLANLEVGSFVWRPSPGHKTTPWLDIYIIDNLQSSSLLLRALATAEEKDVKAATTAEGNDLITIQLWKPQHPQYVQRPRYMCNRQEVVWLIEDVDFEITSSTGGVRALKLWFSWIAESSIHVYEHMEDNPHWFGPLIPFHEE